MARVLAKLLHEWTDSKGVRRRLVEKSDYNPGYRDHVSLEVCTAGSLGEDRWDPLERWSAKDDPTPLMLVEIIEGLKAHLAKANGLLQATSKVVDPKNYRGLDGVVASAEELVEKYETKNWTLPPRRVPSCSSECTGGPCCEA